MDEDLVKRAEEAAKETADRARAAGHRARRKTREAKRDLSMPAGFSPALVGFLRGLIHAAIMGMLSYIAGQASNQEGAGTLGAVATIGVAVVRAIEGLVDGKLLGAPRQKRLLGGKPVR